MGKNNRNIHARPMKHPPRSASAARRMARRMFSVLPVLIEEQQTVTVNDLVENKIITVNGKGEVIYAGE